MSRFDDMAWSIIENRRPPKSEFAEHKGIAVSGRPKNFAELEICLRRGEDWKIAFPSFLDEFYCFRTAEFFEIEPSDFFARKTRAWLAGVSEYLCNRFRLPVPKWVLGPEFFLAEPCSMSHDDTGDPEFRRRNLRFNPRHLLRL